MRTNWALGAPCHTPFLTTNLDLALVNEDGRSPKLSHSRGHSWAFTRTRFGLRFHLFACAQGGESGDFWRVCHAYRGGPPIFFFFRGGPLTTHYSLLTTHYYSLLTTHYSLLTSQLLTTHYSLLTTHYSLLTSE